MKYVIALGFFDGIHVGHGELLRLAHQRAKELGVKPCLLTFDKHPDTLVFHTPVPLINTAAEREAIAGEYYDIHHVLTLHFDRATMELPWEDFVLQLQQYGAVHVVCGYDFRFGYHGAGTAMRLRKKCAERGIGCDIVSACRIDGITVSSTYIRQLLQSGEIERANRFLGHRHRLSGKVTGQPDQTTCILTPQPGIVLPKPGTYEVRAGLCGEQNPATADISENYNIKLQFPSPQRDLSNQILRVDFCQRK